MTPVQPTTTAASNPPPLADTQQPTLAEQLTQKVIEVKAIQDSLADTLSGIGQNGPSAVDSLKLQSRIAMLDQNVLLASALIDAMKKMAQDTLKKI